MKKLMIMATVVIAAVAANAASLKWQANNGFLWNASGNMAAGGSKVTSGTAYLFDSATFTQSELLAALSDSTYASLAAAYSAKGVSGVMNYAGDPVDITLSATGAQFAPSAGFEYGDRTGQTISTFYAAIVSDDVAGAVFVVNCDPVSTSVTAEDYKNIAAQSMSSASMAAVKDTTTFAGAGWYQTVPEPTSGLLLLLGVAGLALKRRRA